MGDYLACCSQSCSDIPSLDAGSQLLAEELVRLKGAILMTADERKEFEKGSEEVLSKTIEILREKIRKAKEQSTTVSDCGGHTAGLVRSKLHPQQIETSDKDARAYLTVKQKASDDKIAYVKNPMAYVSINLPAFFSTASELKTHLTKLRDEEDKLLVRDDQCI